MTLPMSCTSSPRAATSVATQVSNRAATKLHEGGCALTLRHFAIEGARCESRSAELFGEADRLRSGAHEQQCLVFGVAKEHVDGGVESVGLANAQHQVFDVGVGLAKRSALHRDRFLLKSVGESHDFARKSRRHQVGPARLGGESEDAVQLFLEVHVEHLVGLVESDGPKLIERHGASSEVVEKASRGADDDLGKALKLCAFLHDAGSTRDHQNPGAERRVQPGELTPKLPSKLAGRSDEKGDGCGDRGLARFAWSCGGGRNCDARGEEETEGDGLAGARLRGDSQVATLQLGLQDGLLDGRKLFESGFAQGRRRGPQGPALG